MGAEPMQAVAFAHRHWGEAAVKLREGGPAGREAQGGGRSLYPLVMLDPNPWVLLP